MILLEINVLAVAVSVIVFLLVTMLLVSLLLFAKAKLVPEGTVKININGDNELDVNMGGTLLSTLSDNKILLPSACGGGGSCGQCRCQVTEGGGTIFPT
ncbi:MAG: 2Fe-2S iron-sulfur cluster binding domain-containing protein, partial [Paludibacteraceae bacterium]|nr:2Fe-2S iron-sulfur cluster binding domain-containing protein [Paludibacteraceae bacterium]